MRTCWSKRETWSQISFDNSSLSNLLCCRKHKSFHLDTDEHRLTLLSIKRLFLLFLIPLAPFSSVFSQGVPFFNGRYTKELHFLSIYIYSYIPVELNFAETPFGWHLSGESLWRELWRLVSLSWNKENFASQLVVCFIDQRILFDDVDKWENCLRMACVQLQDWRLLIITPSAPRLPAL